MELRQILRSQTASRLPCREALTVPRQAIIRSAIARMKSKQLGCVVIVDSGDRPLGTFTERSVVSLLVNNPEAIDTRPVGEHLDSKSITVRHNDPILSVFESMQNNDARYAVVTSAEGRATRLTGQKGMMDYIASLYSPHIASAPVHDNSLASLGKTRRSTSDALAQAAPANPSNTASPRYGDAVERVLTEHPVTSMQSVPFASVHPSTTILEAVRQLHAAGIACLLVAESERLLGILTLRDLLNKVAENFNKFRDRTVSELMTPCPSFVYDTDVSGRVVSLIVSKGYRHVPLLDSRERLVGIVGPQRVCEFLRKYF